MRAAAGEVPHLRPWRQTAEKSGHTDCQGIERIGEAGCVVYVSLHSCVFVYLLILFDIM